MHEAGSSTAVSVGAELGVVAAADPLVFGFTRFESESFEHATSNVAVASTAINEVVRGT
jgi:hypothetical protein